MTTGDPERRAASPLLCQLGRHAPERLPIWNDGYYFSRCGRCGADIVRPLDGSWQTPKGYRVVWQGGRPADEPTPLLKPETPVSIAEPAVDEAPREMMAAVPPIVAADADAAPEVAEVADAEPAADEAPQPITVAEPPPADADEDAFPVVAEPAAMEPVAEEPAPAMEEELPAPALARRSLIPDFMDDGSATRPLTAGAQADDPAPPPPASRFGEGLNAASLSSMFHRIADARDREEAAESGSVWKSRRFAAAAVVAFGAGAFSVWALGLTDGTRPTSPPAEYRIPATLGQRPPAERLAAGGTARGADAIGEAETSPRPLPAAEKEADPAAAPDKRTVRAAGGTDHVVTASVLNCRKAPSTQASVKLKMVKGVPLTASRQSGEWSYVIRRGHQCWVQTKLIGPR